jgi:hypothetical protein
MLTYNTYLFCLLPFHLFNEITNSAYFLYFFRWTWFYVLRWFVSGWKVGGRGREWGGLFQSAIYVNTNFYIKGLVSKFYEGLTDIIFFSLSKGFFWYNLVAYFRKTGINTEGGSRERMSYFHSFHRQERRHFVSPFFKYMFRPQKWRCHNNKKDKKQKAVFFLLVSIKTIQNSRWLIKGGW